MNIHWEFDVDKLQSERELHKALEKLLENQREFKTRGYDREQFSDLLLFWQDTKQKVILKIKANRESKEQPFEEQDYNQFTHDFSSDAYSEEYVNSSSFPISKIQEL